MKKLYLLTACISIGFVLNAQVSVTPTSIYQEVAQGSTAAITKQITVTNSGSDTIKYNTWNAYDFEPKSGSSVFELKHCNDQGYLSCIGYDEPVLMEAGVKFSKNDLCDKMGTYIAKMLFYQCDDVVNNVIKYRIYGPGDYSSPGELLMEFVNTDNISGKWNTVILPQPLLIDKSELWLSIELFQERFQTPIGIDSGPLKEGGNFLKLNGGKWIEITTEELGVNFLLKATAIGGVVPGCWLSLTGNSHGKIPSGGSANFNAVLNPSGLEYDAYRATITMVTNDQNNPIKEIPTTLVVLPTPPAPIIYVTPKSISETVYEIGTITKQITVTNYGNAAGTYNATMEGVTNNWITLTGNTTGSVASGNSHINFNAVINTGGLEYGVYTATLKVSTSDVKHPLFEIPCKLVYEPASPSMSVSPTSIEETITETNTITIPITISNSGSATGEYEAQLEGASGNWISLSGATTETVSSNSSKTFDAVINAEGLPNDTYTATIKITTNDPAHPLFEIPCTIVVSKEGIATVTLGDQIMVYPNPTRGEFRIEILDMRYEILEIALIDIFGCVVEIAHPPLKNLNPIFSPFGGSPVGEGGWGFNLGGLLPSGAYFVKITTNKGTVTKKIVKQ